METPSPVPVQARQRWNVPYHVALFLLLITIVLVSATQLFQGFWQQRARATHYQAVFLTNGQVYFGKIVRTTSEEILLTNIYYLQSSDALKSDAAKNTNASTSTPAASFSLVKHGGEVHGPLDRMYITRSNILFTEDLRDSSQVVQFIKDGQS